MPRGGGVPRSAKEANNPILLKVQSLQLSFRPAGVSLGGGGGGGPRPPLAPPLRTPLRCYDCNSAALPLPLALAWRRHGQSTPLVTAHCSSPTWKVEPYIYTSTSPSHSIAGSLPCTTSERPPDLDLPCLYTVFCPVVSLFRSHHAVSWRLPF